MNSSLILASACLFAGSSQASVFATEDFAYADGDLVSNAAWDNHSGTAEFIQVVSGEAVMSHGGGSREDAGFNFGFDLTTGVVSASFDLTVTDDTVIGGGDYEYFAHFMEEGNFNFRSRINIVPAATTGDYGLGIASTASTAEATTGDFAYGAVVPVTIEFDLDTGVSSLTAGGSTIFGSASGAGETISRFALRQSNSSNDETIIIDNLQLVPEPASLLLVGAGGLLVAGRRRRA